MRTVTPQNILLAVAAKAGLDITDGGIAALQRPTVLPWIENLTDYLERVWDMWPWPHLMTIEERRMWQGAWAASTVPAGTIVWHTDRYWQALAETTAEPSEASSDWQAYTAEFSFLPYKPRFGAPMGMIHQVSLTDLRIGGIYARCLTAHQMDASGLYFNRVLDKVWLRYAQPYPGFQVYTAAATFEKGEGVYDANDGSFWIAAVDDPTGAPAADNADWTAYFIPAVWRRYLVHKLHAAWLRSEKRLDEASIASNQAERAIDEEMLKLVEEPKATAPVRYR